MSKKAAHSTLRRGGSVWLLLVLVFSLAATSLPDMAMADIAGSLQAEAFVLMDAGTGQVLLERDMHSARKPASITKIMTAMLALENGALGDLVFVSADAVYDVPSDGSSVGLMPGENVPLEEMLFALMLESANEAANAVAEYVSGSMEAFAQFMTQRAKDLGAMNTQFANSNGLNDDKHYTSAYDMALITREAIKNEHFVRIFGTYQSFMEPTNLQGQRRILNNKNRMLPSSSLPYPGILGGKTGFTNASRNTLVEVAQRDGRTLICILLQGPSATANYQDAKRMLDYGFDEFRPVTHADDAYTDAYTYLLHNELSADEVAVQYGQPRENEDGSTSVAISIEAPQEGSDLMYPRIAAITFTTPAPPPPEEESAPADGFGVVALLKILPPFSWFFALFSFLASIVSALFGMINALPGWLAFLTKALLSLFGALFAMAVFFRTRRRMRRRRRMIRKQQQERRRRIYREQSYWS